MGIVSAGYAILLVLTLLLTIVFCVILWDVTSSVETGDRAMGQAFEWLYTMRRISVGRSKTLPSARRS
jgi:hypothetical protein